MVQNAVLKGYKMLLETVPKLVFEGPGARIFWGWVDYQPELGGLSLSRASLAASRAPNLSFRCPQGDYHEAWRPHLGAQK